MVDQFQKPNPTILGFFGRPFIKLIPLYLLHNHTQPIMLALTYTSIMVSIIIGLGESKLTPPGTAYEKTIGVYLDQTEMDILAWQQFCYYVEKEQGEQEVAKYLPNPDVFKVHYGFSFDSANTINKQAFLPIIGITYKQAQAYCIWRSKVVSKRMEINVTYKLPEISHYKKLAEKYAKNITIDSTLVETSKADKTAKYRGLFNNVNELTAENSIVTFDETGTTEFTPSDSSTIFGFRCIATVN